MKKILLIAVIVALVVMFSGCSALSADSNATASPGASVSADNNAGAIEQLTGSRSDSVKILLLITVLAILPSILIMLTCFPRIIIVLSLVRNGLGLQNMPPNQVLVGLALFLTMFVMSPVISQINETAYQPYVEQKIDEGQAIDLAMKPVRAFMLQQTYEKDLDYFVSISGNETQQSVDDIPNTVLIPAYMTSEIKRGFQIGFFLYIPFLVIDMVVASVLMSMGMMMLPPTVISLPFKLLLFVLVDGWMLTVKTLIGSFG